MAGFSFKSNLRGIIEDISETSNSRVKKAAGYSAGVMRKNVGKKGASQPGGLPALREGHLKKSIGYRFDKFTGEAAVGSRSGKVHLLEFGWGEGKERSKRPFIRKSLDQSRPGVEIILAEKYW